MPRIGCLQFAPQVGDVANNLNRADAVLSRADPMELDNLDLLVLPEMAFSGYNFKSLDHIMPYLEPSGSGISALWARTTALKYDCTVAVGYPEIVDSSRRHRGSSPKYYNSLIVVNGDGETVANYRKSFLYYTDATWAQEGGGFYAGEIGNFGKVAMGICMDINPYKFEAPWNAYEFGCHILKVKANLVIVSMAWLTLQNRTSFTPLSLEPDMETLTYWAQRLEPVIRAGHEEEIIVVFCNRCGIEDEVVYAGTSAVIGIKNGEVSVYGLLGRGVKELLIVNTDLPPFAKLVDRSDATETKDQGKDEAVLPVQASPVQSSPVLVSPVQKGLPVDPPTKKERLGGLPEAEEPYEEPTVASPISSLRSRQSIEEQPESPPMIEVGPPGPVIRVFGQPAADDQPSTGSDIEKQQESPLLGRCLGNCNGCAEHIFGGMSDILDTPVFPSPTPASRRPKLAVATGPRSLPPLSTKVPPRGTQPGNFFTSRDLCTPPMTAIDDDPMTAIVNESLIPPSRYIWNHPQPFPPSARLITPEEPVWPPFEMPTITDTMRAPQPKPETRAEVKDPPRPPSRAETKKKPRRPSRIDTSLPAGPQNLSATETSARTPLQRSAIEVTALEAALQETGIFKEGVEIPPRPVSPKSRNASREASRERSRASSRNAARSISRNRSESGNRAGSRDASKSSRKIPSRETSREPGKDTDREDRRNRSREAAREVTGEPGRNTSQEPGRKASRSVSRNTKREESREPGRDSSREPDKDASRSVSHSGSREVSGPREEEAVSPVQERRPLHSEAGQIRGRSRPGRAQSASPARTNTSKGPEKRPGMMQERDEQSDARKAAKTLLTAFKGSIPIIASPSVLKVSFDDSEISLDPAPPPKFGHKRSRSASSVMISFEPAPPKPREFHRMTADFSNLMSNRGLAGGKVSGLRGEGNVSTVRATDELHPGIQALMVKDDEAFLGRTLWRAERWREKREPRRTQSGSRERVTSPVERVQPTFFF
ncbi:hypothetical protein QBC47DRAFT_10793 [Echria macrotheca]|uniref:CN hydrolase domain-containing protein n=1 Tax=Echria macrotheca TaxID=438768 RepID=A0AAJ0BPI1_9PEZI|nr:hypothetical protein QBC47DRAFT_10793 [Echria macrotheca]